MKFAISSLGVLVIVLVIGQTKALKQEDYKSVQNLCLDRNNMTEDEYRVLEQTKDLEGVDKKFKCFAHCLSKELGYLDDVGKYNIKKLEEDTEMNKDDLTKVMGCITKHDKEDDPCEYIFQISKCAIGVLKKEVDVN